MKWKHHFCWIVAGAAGFFLAARLVGYVVPAGTALGGALDLVFSWFPVRVGLWFGHGGHDVSATAAYCAWVIECLVFGILLDLGRWVVRRRK